MWVIDILCSDISNLMQLLVIIIFCPLGFLFLYDSLCQLKLDLVTSNYKTVVGSNIVRVDGSLFGHSQLIFFHCLFYFY